MASQGYSLLVFITAEDFQPIPLGMGFTLLGIGGMVAIHRTFDEDVLRDGPEERHAGQPAVPARPGRQRAGDHPRRRHGVPGAQRQLPARAAGAHRLVHADLVTADLALIVEFGARKRLLVLGPHQRAACRRPTTIWCASTSTRSA